MQHPDSAIQIRAKNRNVITGKILPAFLLLPILLILSACGNGNMFNGVGGNGTGTLQGAEKTALQHIANGNYAAAASDISPYCPNNVCPDTTSANILTDSYIALGTASGATYQAASTILVASVSGGYVGTNQIIANLISLAQNASTASQTFDAIAQVVPCIETNQCTTAGIDDLKTAVQVQINSGCTQTACDPNLASMYALVAAVYILANLQYQTGLTYINGTWELCTANGGGLHACSPTLSSISVTATSDINNDCWLLFAGISGASSVCGSPTLSSSPASLASVVSTIATTLGTSAQNLTNSLNQLLNAVITCQTSCSTSNSSSTPTSVSSVSSFSTALTNYLKAIQTF
ncbi:MAG: hypothetical protein ACYC9S_06895 [Leptospirales bacterium]